MTKESESNRELSKWLKVLSLLPIALLCNLILFWSRVGLKIGKLPEANLPDPKSVAMDVQYDSIYFMFFLLLPVLLFIGCFQRKLSSRWKLFLGFQVLFLVGFYWTDPKGIIYWFLD